MTRIKAKTRIEDCINLKYPKGVLASLISCTIQREEKFRRVIELLVSGKKPTMAARQAGIGEKVITAYRRKYRWFEQAEKEVKRLIADGDTAGAAALCEAYRQDTARRLEWLNSVYPHVSPKHESDIERARRVRARELEQTLKGAQKERKRIEAEREATPANRPGRTNCLSCAKVFTLKCTQPDMTVFSVWAPCTGFLSRDEAEAR